MESSHMSLNLRNVFQYYIVVDKYKEESYFGQMSPLTLIYQLNFSFMFGWLRQNFSTEIEYY